MRSLTYPEQHTLIFFIQHKLEVELNLRGKMYARTLDKPGNGWYVHSIGDTWTSLVFEGSDQDTGKFDPDFLDWEAMHSKSAVKAVVLDIWRGFSDPFPLHTVQLSETGQPEEGLLPDTHKLIIYQCTTDPQFVFNHHFKLK